MCKEEYAKAIDSALFPGSQGGPLMHVIAAKAVCLSEAIKPEFKDYQAQIVTNAKAMAEAMLQKGYFLTSGGTDNHLMLVDLRPTHPELTGKDAQLALDKTNITINKNTVPGETRSPFKASGIRLGTPAVTSRGMRDQEMREIVRAIDLVLSDPQNEQRLSEAREIALGLCRDFPLPY